MQVVYTIYHEKMILPRIKYFAEDGKKGHTAAKNTGLIGVGVGIASSFGSVGNLISEECSNYLKNSSLKAKDADSIKKKLLDQAKKDGGPKIIDDFNFNNSAYTGGNSGKMARDLIAGLRKKARSTGNKRFEKAAEKLESRIKKKVGGNTKVFKNLGKDTVILGYNGGVDALAHELGHSNYLRSGRSKSIIGKVAHKLMPISSPTTNKLGRVAIAANGFQSGLESAKLKAEGKKESTWNKVKAAAVPAALAAPLLVAEGKASLNGLKNMKKLGASKELMKESRKRLGAAWGTYAGKTAVKSIALGEGSRYVGKGIGSIIYKDKKKDDTIKK